MIKIGVLKFCTHLWGDQRSYIAGLVHGGPLNSQSVNHSSSVTRAGRADAVLVDVRKSGNHRDSIADVGEDLAAPITRNLIDKLLAVAGRAARIGSEHDVTVVGPDLRIPAIAPVIVPGALWS